MASLPKEILSWNTRYVRADIADENKRQRDLLLVAAAAAILAAYRRPSTFALYRENMERAAVNLRDAVAECECNK